MKFAVLTFLALIVFGVILYYFKIYKKPVYGLLLCAILVPLINLGGTLNALLYTIINATIVFYTFSSNRKGKSTKFYSKIQILGISFLVLGLLSSLVAATNLREAISTVFDQTNSFLLFILVYKNINNNKALVAIIDAISIGLFVEALLGFYQWRFGSTGLAIFRDLRGSWRSAGSLQLPNLFASYLLFTMIVPLARIIFSRFSLDKNMVVKGSLVLLALVSLSASFSRSAWVSFVGQIVFLLMLFFSKRPLRRRVYKASFLMGLLLLPIATIYGGRILSRFTHVFDSMEHRQVLVDAAFYTMKTKPFLGVGPNNYARWGYPSFIHYRKEHQRIPENTFLQIGVEYGVPALIIFSFILFFAFWDGYRILRKLASKGLFLICAALLASFFGFLVQSFGVPEFRHYPIQVLFWSELAVLASLEKLNLNMKHLNMVKRKSAQRIQSR